jgi:hypothetical protein
LLWLDLIEEHAEAFSVDATERENRPWGRAKNERGGRIFGQLLPRRRIEEAREFPPWLSGVGRTEALAFSGFGFVHNGLASKKIRL